MYTLLVEPSYQLMTAPTKRYELPKVVTYHVPILKYAAVAGIARAMMYLVRKCLMAAILASVIIQIKTDISQMSEIGGIVVFTHIVSDIRQLQHERTIFF